MKRLISTILLFALFISAIAQVDRSVRPAPGPAPLIEIGQVKSFTLDNGMRVFVVENSKIARVTFSMIFDYDPVFEGQHAGLVDMTGQLLRTATSNRTKEQIDNEIDFIGATLSTSATGVYASGLSRHALTISELMADIVINARFEQAHFDRIKTQTISGLAAEKNNPSALASRVQKVLLYGEKHPYGLNPTEQSINMITLDMCREFYGTYYKPGTTYLAVVGDIKLEDARKMVEQHFGSWPVSEVPTHLYPTPKPPKGVNVAIVDRPNAVQSTINVCFPVDLKPGSEGALKARVMNSILGGSSSRLFNNLRETHGFTYGAYSELSSDKLIGYFNASTDVRNSATDSAVYEILYEINRMRQELVPDDELRLYKNEINGNFALSLESPQTVANFALNIARYKLPEDYYTTYLQRLASINANDVQETSNQYLFPDNAHILVVGKASEIADGLKKFASDGRIHYYDEDGKEYDPAKKLKPVPTGMTAEQVTKNYIEAIGGEKKLRKITDLSISMTSSMQGMTLNFDLYNKAPNKMVMEIGSGGTVFSKQVFDGTKGMMFSPMGNEPITGDMLEILKYQAIMNIELDYEKYGITQELLGIETIQGKDTYKLEVKYPSGKSNTMYYDVESGLRTRAIAEEGVSDFSDYREVDGIKFPFMLKQAMGPQVFDLKVIAVKLNSKIKDEFFKVE